MEVQLTPDQKVFTEQAIKAGRFRTEEEAVREALALWELQERTRSETLEALHEAEASLARGEGRGITLDSMREMADAIKQRGRERIAAGRNITA